MVYKRDSTSERTSPSERSRRSRQENRGAFAGPYRSGMGSGGGTGSNCDVTPDGRFVMIRDEESSNLVVLNWLEELERLVPNGKVITTFWIEKTHRAGHVCQDLVLEQLGEDECMAVRRLPSTWKLARFFLSTKRDGLVLAGHQRRAPEKTDGSRRPPRDRAAANERGRRRCRRSSNPPRSRMSFLTTGEVLSCVWCERPPPKGGGLKLAYVVESSAGPKAEWPNSVCHQLNLTVTRESHF